MVRRILGTCKYHTVEPKLNIPVEGERNLATFTEGRQGEIADIHCSLHDIILNTTFF